METFITANDSEDFYFVFIDNLEKKHESVSEVPITTPESSAWPFLGKSAQECHELLRKLVEETGSDVDYDCFAMMDARSAEDSTLILAEGEDEEVDVVRARFEDASLVMLNLRAGNGSVLEYQEEAEMEEDGVLKMG